jgi:tubulin polyglutamylase TTLL6/13
MVDHKLNPYLLEINYTPSFTTDTPLDRYIKKNLIKDTLHLLNINEKWKREMKLKRDRDMQERMVTGKRKKYTPEERIILSLEETKKRN